ncbi:3'-5' exonuclease [Guggenheimella bovis]
MNERLGSYTAVDVETPSRRNDTICSIGIIRVEDGRIEERFRSFVNPEDQFDMANIQIHHITPDMVQDAPTFGELWPEIRHFFIGRIVIAHNAGFDLGVIRKNLLRYGIYEMEMSYYCTVQLGKKAFPHFDHHNLKAMTTYLDVELDQHHDAYCDALACQGIFECIQSKLRLTAKELRTYHLKTEEVMPLEEALLKEAKRDLKKALGRVNLIEELKEWLLRYEIYEDAYPIGNTILLVQKILADGVVTEEEHRILEHHAL